MASRADIALAVKEGTRKVKLPDFKGWNSDNSLKHFQEVGVAFLYAIGKGILADPVGLGKTPQALGLIQLLKETDKPYRTILFVRSYNMQLQWLQEVSKFTNLRAVMVDGPKAERMTQYSSWWEVLVCRYSTLLRDFQLLKQLSYDQVVCDEPSDSGVGIHHGNTKTHSMIKGMTQDCPRVVGLDATPIQNSLLDMYNLQSAFCMGIFGSTAQFEGQYIRRETINIRKKSAKPRRGRNTFSATKIVGHKNVAEFKELIKPYVLRRKIAEVEAEMPEVVTKDIWLELPPQQRGFYNQARNGLITLWETKSKDDVITKVKQTRKIRAGFHHLQYACDTTMPFSKDSPESVKADWLASKLTTDLEGQKVVVFSKYLVGVDQIVSMLRKAGIGHRVYVGQSRLTPEEQAQAVADFWNDDAVQVLVGTSAMERGLNLQKSAYLVNFNQMWNPTRMLQLLGRIRRIGSEHVKVTVINLLTENTIEAKLQRLLRERAAVADYVWDESNDLFESLTTEELIALIQE